MEGRVTMEVMEVKEDLLSRIYRIFRGGYTLAEVRAMWVEQHYPGLSKEIGRAHV